MTGVLVDTNVLIDYLRSHGVDLIDGIIAATAVACELTLVTLNVKHFPMLRNIVTPYRRRI